MARLKTLQPRVVNIGPRLKTDTPMPGESGWAARERLQGNRHQRGYGTAWSKLRLTILARDKYLCQICLADGRPTPATEVDHIVPKANGGSDDQCNLQSLCNPCHLAKTSRESKAR